MDFFWRSPARLRCGAVGVRRHPGGERKHRRRFSASLLLAGLAGADDAELGEVCGCSWRGGAGCATSGEQTIANLEALPLAVPGCAFGHGVGSEECQLRREVSRVAGQFRECFDFDALECNTSQLCRWGAQSSGACGFDEDAMLGLLHIPDEQPMMQAMRMRIACSTHGVETCGAQRGCFWTAQSSPPARCDVDPLSLPGSAHVETLVDLEGVTVEAACRAKHEARPGFAKSCSEPCQMHHGVCTMRGSWEAEALLGSCLHVEEARKSRSEATALRRPTALLEDPCPETWCQRDHGICIGSCEHVHIATERVSERRLKLVTLLWGATVLQEIACRSPELSLRSACQRSSPLCEADAGHGPGVPLGSRVEAQPASTMAPAFAMAAVMLAGASLAISLLRGRPLGARTFAVPGGAAAAGVTIALREAELPRSLKAGAPICDC